MCLLLIALDLAVFAPVWHHSFLNFDDPGYITGNAEVRAGLTWHGVVWAFTARHEANWHPLTWLSHMLDVQLYGLSPGPHHLTNVAMHIASTLLLFSLFRSLTGQAWQSALVAALFGVHPLHVESVAWAAERKDVLSTLFWMLTLWAYVVYVRRPGWGRYLVVLGLFALGLMSKPMLVTLPFVLLLLDFWPLGRLVGTRGSLDRAEAPPFADARSVLRLVMEKVPFLVLTIASSVVTLIVQRLGGALLTSEAIPFSRRLGNALVAYVAYLIKTFWPTQLGVLYFNYYDRSLPLWWIVGSVVVLVAVTLAVVWAARRAPYLPVGWFWYLGVLVPVIGLVQVGSQRMADRYTYVPLIGVFIMVAWGLPDLLARWSRRRVALPLAAGLAILGCVIVASQQVRHWRNSEALWTRGVAVDGNWLTHFMLAAALADGGKFDQAAVNYAAVVRLVPRSAEGHNLLGYALWRLGKTEEAIERYQEALRLWPEFAEAHSNLGVALAKQGRPDEAIREFLTSLRLKPDDTLTHINVAMVLTRKGKPTEAAHHYREVLRVEPEHPEAHYRLGLLLADQGKAEEAGRHLQMAAQLDPRLQRARQAPGDPVRPRPGAGSAPR